MEYVNTCNGVVLLADGGDKDSARCRCFLWNPAVADVVEEVSVSIPDAAVVSTDVVKDYRALGLGYGHRNKAYKLILLCRTAAAARRKQQLMETTAPPGARMALLMIIRWLPTHSLTSYRLYGTEK
jgi:hypothetical protein